MQRIGSLLPLLVLLAACSHDGNETVTGTGSMVKVTIVVSATTSHAIQKARLLFDGREIATVEPDGGAAQIMLDAVVNGVTAGPHVIKVVIDRQATSPTGYRVGGSVSTADRILDLAPVERVLSTGEAVELNVSL